MPRVAVAQIRPVHLNLAQTLTHIEDAVREAARGGAEMIALGESALPGYPAWLDHTSNVARWDHPPTKKVFARLRANSLTIPGPEATALSALAKELGVVLVVGAHERVDGGPGHGTLYNVLLAWNESGELAIHHRKLVPTYTERLLWGPGDAAGLHSIKTKVGRVSGLICWEHWMPLARQALHDGGEDIHVAVWPTANDAHHLASRHYAFEGRCFVLVAGTIMRGDDLPAEFRSDTALADDDFCLRGGSAIIGPTGEYVAQPVYDEETILYADLDLRRLDEERMTLDVTGHYARPDVLRLDVDRRRGN